MGVQITFAHPIFVENDRLYRKKTPKSGCAAAQPAHPAHLVLPPLWIIWPLYDIFIPTLWRTILNILEFQQSGMIKIINTV